MAILRVLSIDVGIKNLAFCDLEVDKTTCRVKIRNWKVVSVIDEGVNCKKLELEVITEQMISCLMEWFGKFDVNRVYDLVLIENQPSNKNRTMKSISIEIYTFFTILKMMHGTVRKIRFVSAKHKLSLASTDATSRTINKSNKSNKSQRRQRSTTGTKAASAAYRDRKKQAIQLVRSKYLPLFADESLTRLFESTPKKDDLADCLLQCIYYVQAKLLGCRLIVG